MIWFACKQCQKVVGRPDSSSGTILFCDCGHGNRVPWESTAAEPEVDVAEPIIISPLPAEPPIPVLEERKPERPPRRFASDDLDRTPKKRRSRRSKPNPSYCVNHPDYPSRQKCNDCANGFCDACVASFQDATLCGPCKNLRARRLQHNDWLGSPGSLCLIFALIGGPLSFCLSMLGVNHLANGDGSLALTIFLCVFGSLMPIAGLILGQLALKQIASKPLMGGTYLALTGSVTSLLGLLWCLTVMILLIAKQWQS